MPTDPWTRLGYVDQPSGTMFIVRLPETDIILGVIDAAAFADIARAKAAFDAINQRLDQAERATDPPTPPPTAARAALEE